MNINKTGTNQDTLYKVTEEFPDDTSPAMIEDFVNEKLDDNNKMI